MSQFQWMKGMIQYADVCTTMLIKDIALSVITCNTYDKYVCVCVWISISRRQAII